MGGALVYSVFSTGFENATVCIFYLSAIFNVSCSPTLSEASVGSWAGVTTALLPRGLQGCMGLDLHRERGRPGDRPV